MMDGVKAHRGRGGARLVVCVGLALAVALGTVAGSVIDRARRDAWAGARASAGNLVSALARDIGHNMSLLGLSMQGVEEAMSEPGIDAVPEGIRRRALFDRSMDSQYLGFVLVIGPDGRILEDSTRSARPGLDLSDREYFRVQGEAGGAGLYVSTPFSSRLREGGPTLALSRRLPDRDGRFAGVVAAGLRIAYFDEKFSQLDIGAHGTIALLRDDGILVARRPESQGLTGLDVSARPTFAAMRGRRSGSFESVSDVDGTRRLYTFDHVGDLPLVIVVGQSVGDIDAAWLGRAVVIGPAIAALALAVVVFSAMVGRQMARCEATERRLAEANEVLRVQASTDPLTGLANRRSLDRALEREWRRAGRTGTPTSMLVVDADRFKSYNDAYGHGAGDRVLKAVAEALSSSLLRPGDLAVRFGGEEFVALLPATGPADALRVATRVADAVRALAIPHRGNLGGVVTVSVGVATALPGAGMDVEGLFVAADRAVYDAKAAGRDRVSVATIPTLRAA